MENTESKSTSNKWLKIIYIVIPIIIVFLLIINYRLNKIENATSESITLKKVILDFQNKSGVARITSSFTDLLVGSDGSKKQGNGYLLLLKIINPSTIALRNITCNFRHSYSDKSATYQNVNTTIAPGSSITVPCFISDLFDEDLKSVEVSVEFGQMSSY